MCWSIDYSGKSNSPVSQSKQSLSHWEIHFEPLETRESLRGYVSRQIKELSYVASAPICFHDNPLLPIMWWNVAPYDIWVWRHANHRSLSLISRAPVRPDTHTHTAFYELLFSRWDESSRALSKWFFIPWDHSKFFFFFLDVRLLRAWASSGNLDVLVFLLSLIHLFFLTLRFKWGSVCWVLSMAVHFRSRWPNVLCFFFLPPLPSWQVSPVLRGSCWVHVCLQEEI